MWVVTQAPSKAPTGQPTNKVGEVYSVQVNSDGERVMYGGDMLYPEQFITDYNDQYALRYASDGNLIVSKIIILF